MINIFGLCWVCFDIIKGWVEVADVDEGEVQRVKSTILCEKNVTSRTMILKWVEHEDFPFNGENIQWIFFLLSTALNSLSSSTPVCPSTEVSFTFHFILPLNSWIFDIVQWGERLQREFWIHNWNDINMVMRWVEMLSLEFALHLRLVFFFFMIIIFIKCFASQKTVCAGESEMTSYHQSNESHSVTFHVKMMLDVLYSSSSIVKLNFSELIWRMLLGVWHVKMTNILLGKFDFNSHSQRVEILFCIFH